ncbi:GlxA family transcriptional regulator [Thiovibrio frasassiensis]|uniref:Helix-turn-helix domain-containing protein n=1 Tax=Thiovibrio frasassiensis TaxID=2984131 RepID=A0A9X4MR25_9BACT|nr:helix-turn-helix domain-containing protein [Thiovibrio frasassiensis]MDG4477092.1 helix-turn-helix domain-containing protein [Thiovibrio frasassiensis]
MKKVTILALDGASATTITGPMDVFTNAGVLWNKIFGQSVFPFFEVEIATISGKPIICNNNLPLQPHTAIRDITQTDLIIVPAVFNIENSLAKHGNTVIPWLIGHYEQGAHLASICTGSFVLALTGLLNGREATTHWAVAEEFRQLYPKVILKPEKLITDAGDIFCSGSFSSCIDLAMYLVEKYCGHQVAVECSKALAHDMGRFSQAPYMPFRFQRNHKDDAVLRCQHFLEEQFPEEIDIEVLAGRNGMGRRTMERRFKAATGDTPLSYLQRVRVEQAKKMLESGRETFDEISYKVGYEDSSFFRRVFRKYTGLKPTEYRGKFQRIINMSDS